jgi:NADH-quinone oxidoreductase subunit H
MNETLMQILIIVGVLLGTVTIAAGLIYVERKMLAVWQQRLVPIE